jgi:Endonuclease/Exonuclease/phosphatase family
MRTVRFAAVGLTMCLIGLADSSPSSGSTVEVPSSGATADMESATDLPAATAPTSRRFGVGQHRIHHWNMCGNACPLADGEPGGVEMGDSPAVVLWIADHANPKPLAIGLNEACFVQLQNIDSPMGGEGYNFSAATRVVTNPSSNPECGLYGNAVFHIGNWISETEIDMGSNAPGDHDDRSAVCVKFDMFAKVIMCSGHATNHSNEDAYAIPQINTYRNEVNSRFAGKCRWITGDFNVDQTQSPSSWKTAYDASYEEVDEPAPWQPTHDSNTKIDWMWISEAQHTQTYNLQLSDLQPTSDHKYLVGSLSFASSCPL